MKPRITYANVAATLALFFALGGTAVAARHYLINSTRQIKPSVLASLKGNSGVRGATGKEGPQGKEGPLGKEGALGKEGPQGQEGKEGAQGSARAFATINTKGEVSHAKGITTANVTLAGGSLYCIGGLSFSPENVIVSPVTPEAGLIIANAAIRALGVCPGGTQVSIVTYNVKEAAQRAEVSVMIN